MTPRQQRRFRQQFAAQVNEERNGKPIDGEMAARMTRPKNEQPLFQVIVTRREDGGQLAIGPMMGKVYCEELAATINRYVIDGKEKIWSNAAVAPTNPISTGAF